MKEDIKIRWVAELRSGRHLQTTGCLLDAKTGGMCCLGVLVLKVLDRDAKGKALLSYDDMEAAGIKSQYGDLPTGPALSSLNDHGKTFPEIADIIEQHWQDL